MVCARLILLSAFFLQVSQATYLPHLQAVEESRVASVEASSRVKREECEYGTYLHEGKNCCKCGAGQHVKHHCTTSPGDRVCELCEEKHTYNTHPNSQETCQPCASCSQDNANMEVAESCTPAKNTVCRCKRGFFCNKENCEICFPCEECASAGIKVACTATNNTICNDGHGNNSAVITGVITAVIAVAAIVVSVYFFTKKRRQGRGEIPVPTREAEEILTPEIPSIADFERHLPEIAEVLGWKDVQDVAIRSGVSQTVIDSYKLNHPNDAEERSLQLLRRWAEHQGINASKKLIEILQKSGKKGKMEKVLKILKNSNQV